MKLKNLKHFFITSLISSVSFLLNILPARAGNTSPNEDTFNFGPEVGIVETPRPTGLDKAMEIIERFIKFFSMFAAPIVIVVILIVIVVRFFKQKKESKKSTKSKSKKTKK